MSGTVFTGKGIEYYRWVTAKSAVKLKMKGIYMIPSRRFTQLKQELGLKPRCKDSEFLAAVEAKIELVRASLGPDDIRSV